MRSKSVGVQQTESFRRMTVRLCNNKRSENLILTTESWLISRLLRGLYLQNTEVHFIGIKTTGVHLYTIIALVGNSFQFNFNIYLSNKYRM